MRRKTKSWSSAAARRLKSLAGNPSTIQEAVETVASKLLEDIPCPPTSLDDLKSRLNVRAFERVEGLPISGELRRDGAGFIIAYASSLSPGRRRFTIAHELSHAIFETSGPNCPRHGKELEQLCDMLAAELLLPRKIFIQHVGSNFRPETIYQVARRFDTSVMATAMRFYTVYRASVFQVENGRVAWGVGAIRHHRDLQFDRDVFERTIAKAMDGIPGEELIYRGASSHTLQWDIMSGQRASAFLSCSKSA